MGKDWIWEKKGFEDFRKGTFGNGGQNIYVSAKGILQRIYQYDLDKNGYVDLVFANCQNHHESAPSYVYQPDGSRATLPGQGALSGMAVDLTGDGYQDIVVAGHYDMVAPYASADIYFGSAEGYSEKYHIKLPAPFTKDCCHGDFNGKGKQMLVFAMPVYPKVRIFEQTHVGFEWHGFTDLEIKADLVAAADLDGDGYDDLIVRAEKETKTVIYWGGPDGLDTAHMTVLPELPAEEVVLPEEEESQQSEMERKEMAVRRLQSVCWNGRNCFTLSTGKKVLLYSATAEEQLECVLELEVPMAQAIAIGDIDGDGYEDIAVAGMLRDEKDHGRQLSFIIWNGAEGPDSRPRTVIPTVSACDVAIMDGKVLFCQANAGYFYTNDSLLFTWPDLEKPVKLVGEDARRCALIRNPDGVLQALLVNHMSRSSIGFDETYIYWGAEDGYDPKRMLEVPGHCAVDALIADFNDDGWPELLVANNSENSADLDVGHHMHYFGPNGFEPEKTHTLKTDLGWGVVSGDFDHDGYLEIITPAGWWKELRQYSAKDGFQSYKVIELPEGSSARWPVAVDLNQDGWLDLAVPCGGKNAIIYWGGPEGFSLKNYTELSTWRPIGATAADLTGNGYPDLIIGGHTETPVKGSLTPQEPHHSFVYIYWNGPEGISENRKCVLRGDAADSFAIADFNNDGWLDIFTGSYHGGKDRDINSFLYWNREGHFSEHDRDLLYTHSASGCMAADFNHDGYVDLAIANHKVDGDHEGYSSVWWNGPKGFNSERCTDLPTNGPHGMISNDIGNILDRSGNEYYYSEAYTAHEGRTLHSVSWEAVMEDTCKVWMEVRTADSEEELETAAWSEPIANGEDVSARQLQGNYIQYKLVLYARNGCGTPRVESISLKF